MQVMNEPNTEIITEKIPQTYIPALPYIEEKKEVTEEIPKDVKNRSNDRKLTRREKKDSREEYLKQSIIEEEGKTENETTNEDFGMSMDSVSTHDSRKLMRMMDTDLENIKQMINFCRKPPISDDWEENREVRKRVKTYLGETIYHDADMICDYIEGLTYYGSINPNLFGTHNYLLNETIEGYKSIYGSVMKMRDENKPYEALRWLNKLVICAMRPLVESNIVNKSKVFEEAIATQSLKIA